MKTGLQFKKTKDGVYLNKLFAVTNIPDDAVLSITIDYPDISAGFYSYFRFHIIINSSTFLKIYRTENTTSLIIIKVRVRIIFLFISIHGFIICTF